MTVNAQEAAADRHLVYYDNFYHVQHPLHKTAKFIHPVNCRSLIYKQNGNSQLLLDTLRVLGIILQQTLFRPVTWREGAPANQATLGGLTSHMFF